MRAVGLLCLVLATPAAASANELTDAGFELTEEHATVTLAAAESIGDVRVRTSPGSIRVWLADMDDVFLDPRGDGWVVRNVRIRPGVDGSAVMRIRLGDRRVVAHEAIDIERDDARATLRVRIAATALPAPRAIEPEPVLAAEPVAEPEEETGSLPMAAEADATEEAATASEDEADPEVDDEETLPAAATGATSTGRTNREARSSTIPSGEGSALPTLILVTLLLGLIYLAARIFMSGKKKSGPTPAIEIVSNKRLGARHQLMLVRALGQDHLLSVNGGTTSRITSSPAPATPAPSEERAPAGIRSGILERISEHLSFGTKNDDEQDRALVDTVLDDRAAPADDDARDSEPEFGAQLLEFAEAVERRRSGRAPAPLRTTGGESEAVAGLIRLRQRAAAR